MAKGALIICEYRKELNSSYKCNIENFLHNVKKNTFIEIVSINKDKTVILEQIIQLLSSLNKDFILEQIGDKRCDGYFYDGYYMVNKPNYTKRAL
jgi:hypothetical protein